MRVASARARVLKRYSSLYLSVLTRVAGAEATILTPDTRSPDAAPTLASMVTSLSILAPKGQLARERGRWGDRSRSGAVRVPDVTGRLRELRTGEVQAV